MSLINLRNLGVIFSSPLFENLNLNLAKGDRIGLVNPATAAFETGPIDILRESLEALGLAGLSRDEMAAMLRDGP